MTTVENYEELSRQMKIASFSFDNKRYAELKAQRDLIVLSPMELEQLAKPYYGKRPPIDLDGIIDFVKKVLKPQA